MLINCSLFSCVLLRPDLAYLLPNVGCVNTLHKAKWVLIMVWQLFATSGAPWNHIETGDRLGSSWFSISGSFSVEIYRVFTFVEVLATKYGMGKYFAQSQMGFNYGRATLCYFWSSPEFFWLKKSLLYALYILSHRLVPTNFWKPPARQL